MIGGDDFGGVLSVAVWYHLFTLKMNHIVKLVIPMFAPLTNAFFRS